MSSQQTFSFSRLLQPLVAPDVFDFWASKISPTLAWNRALAKVVERHVEAKDTVTLVLKCNRHFKGYEPGQHLNVMVEVDGVRLTRSYSPTSLPGKGRRLAITVKRVEGGKVSTQLCTRTQVGDVIELGDSFGEMTLANSTCDKWLFVAAGSGITPLISLTRALAAQGRAKDVVLLYWARTRADVCFATELKELAKQQVGFRAQVFLTRETSLLEGELSGRPSGEQIEQLVPDLAERTVYACGPAGFVTTIRNALQAKAGQFKEEAFSLPEPEETNLLADAAGETVQVQLALSGRTLTVPVGQPLLNALEEQGIQPAYGCRMGICKTCVCSKTGGTTRDLMTGYTEPEPDQALRLCISSAVTDVTLDL